MLKKLRKVIGSCLQNTDSRLSFYMFALTLTVLIVTAVAITLYYQEFNKSLFPTITTSVKTSDVRAEWGQLGDFFGGVLNPIFGFASFIALLITIIYQAKELNASTEELKNSAIALAAQNKAIELQSFEQTFFSWLNTYRDLLIAVSGKINNNTFTGRNFLYSLWEKELSDEAIAYSMFTPNIYGGASEFPREEFKDSYENSFIGISSYNKIETISNKKPIQSTNNILVIWCQLYRKDEYQLDSVFRTLYRLLIWIDSQQSERLSNAQKWLYISIVRSQLSWIEMTYLYYNGLTPPGSKFKLIVEKYALFDNLTIDSDIGMKVLNRHLPLVSNYSEHAFNSEIAREKLGLPKSSEDTLALATATPPLSHLRLERQMLG